MKDKSNSITVPCCSTKEAFGESNKYTLKSLRWDHNDTVLATKEYEPEIKNKKCKINLEDKADDVKTLFDSLRNMSICVGLTLSLPIIQDTIGVGFWGASITYFSYGVILGLYALNILFTLVKLKEKPSSPPIYYLGFTAISLVTTFITGGLALKNVHNEIFNFNILNIFNEMVLNVKNLF